MPLGHLGINVADLHRAKAYYDELMPLVGFEPFFAADDEFSYRPVGGKPGTFIFFYPAHDSSDYSRHRPGLQHLAFIVDTRERVYELSDWARARDAEIVHPPQEFPQYHPGYFAVFWVDEQGILLEAVCHKEQPEAAR